MRSKTSILWVLTAAVLTLLGRGLLSDTAHRAFAYPPAVGILGKAKNCLACHVNNGPWKDDARTVIDIVDQDSKASLKQPGGTFLIEVKRGQTRTVLTVLSRSKGDSAEPPYRNAWLYIDPKTIKTASLSKFAPGWDVNLPMSCRVVGDKMEGYEGASLTVLPMTVRPTDAAQSGELVLQVMLTKGDSVKGNTRAGMVGSYFERRVQLKVID
mgnify:CR=1 FL=1